MGVPSSPFIDTYNDKINDLMVKLVEYIQVMDNFLHPPSSADPVPNPGGIYTGPAPGPTGIPTKMIIQEPPILEQKENGYPILPNPIPSDGWKKTAWDSLFTDYIGKQYQLACGGKPNHIPYKCITEKQQDFIQNKYLPRKTIF
jgi:hypothetical protein